ncbi:MAG: ATP-binding cassette domain-containing protein [candidate division SR1 bacterium]|nr:ATP-binding cassette domain-containing protein [candidate division SR1 bacterium]
MYIGPLALNKKNLPLIDNVVINLEKPIYHLWGKNGVGKSTLIKLILADCIEKKIRFAFMDQNYRTSWLWWMKIEENLDLITGNIHSGKKFIELDIYNRQQSWIKPLLSKIVAQYDFSKGNEIQSAGVSGGQLQRLIFLRELIAKPEIVLLDEAFSALDIEVVEDVISWLLEEQKRLDFKIVNICHDKRIIELMKGKVIVLDTEGTPKKLTLTEMSYEEMV